MKKPEHINSTRLINLRGQHVRPGDATIAKDGEVIIRGWHYIGRVVRGRSHGGYIWIPASRWANPFKPGRDGTLEECLAKYEARILASPELLARLPALKGKTLACWCAPDPCHEDVLIKLIGQL